MIAVIVKLSTIYFAGKHNSVIVEILSKIIICGSGHKLKLYCNIVYLEKK